jgi:hypothetical protein
MAGLSVTGLRDLARGAMLSCGARGFVRFTKSGEGLLVTDAASRCEDGGSALTAALDEAGFSCRSDGGLLLITPGDALLERLCAGEDAPCIDWDSPLHPAQALAARLMREQHTQLDDSGRALVLLTARLLWQPQDKVLAGLMDIRALAAVHMREGNRNGFVQAGRLLHNWCQEQTKGDDAR